MRLHSHLHHAQTRLNGASNPIRDPLYRVRISLRINHLRVERAFRSTYTYFRVSLPPKRATILILPRFRDEQRRWVDPRIRIAVAKDTTNF